MMTIIVNVHEAKTHLSRLLEQAHAGEEIILAKAGKPYARLMPLEVAPSRRQPGRLTGTLGAAFFEPLPGEELRAWTGD
jgi:prevent-host-death family protein